MQFESKARGPVLPRQTNGRLQVTRFQKTQKQSAVPHAPIAWLLAPGVFLQLR
jgi:hypothetical protein